MKRTFIVSIVIVCSQFLAGCQTDTAWRRDCGAFVQTLTDLAPKASVYNTGRYSDQFKGKEVTWNLTFKEIKQDAKGGEDLLFDLEPFGINHKFFSGKPVMMGFKSAAGNSEVWKTTTPGSQVRISAVVADVRFLNVAPGNNPDSQSAIAVASLENVKRVSD